MQMHKIAEFWDLFERFGIETLSHLDWFSGTIRNKLAFSQPNLAMQLKFLFLDNLRYHDKAGKAQEVQVPCVQMIKYKFTQKNPNLLPILLKS